MNRELNEMLEAASADVREVDFTERAWAGAERRRARTRRTALAGVAAAAAVAVVAGTFLAGHRTPAPATPAPSITQTATPTAWRVAPDGTRYVIAPPLGTEASLPSAAYGLGHPLEKIDPVATRRELADVVANDPSWRSDLPVAVFLEALDAPGYADAATFQPVFARIDGSLVTTGIRLGWVHDAGGNHAVPLSEGSLSYRRVAFAQPGTVVVVELVTGSVKSYPVPSQTIERVRWAGSAVIASGDNGAWQIDTSASAPTAEKLPAGYTGAKNVIEVNQSGSASVTTWELGGLKRTTAAVTAPVFQPYGQTFSSNLMAASAVFLSGGLNAGDGEPLDQGILSVPLSDPSTRRLLVMGESPARNKGCCQVVGFSQQGTPLYTTATAAGVWLLQWNPETGFVSRVLLLEDNPAIPPVLSIGVNITS